MLASVALQILPETLDDEQTIKVVDEVIAYMKSTGLECYVAPFETAIEGSDIDQLMDIMKECLHIAGKANNKGVAAFIKVVYRPDGDVLTIEKKVTKHHL
ncbi:MAG: thiamine-binding protein [Firmicutes bacterium]|uniref:Thiamine-binding protein n=1 Tax=Candidatus Stercoripulliclostridium pullicola TaxID=2840953 RepID=A0A940IDK2_9FIRM|nr:thiamine-binding protein [Candidatus Stercoripulliclostridium pullicola]